MASLVRETARLLLPRQVQLSASSKQLHGLKSAGGHQPRTDRKAALLACISCLHAANALSAASGNHQPGSRSSLIQSPSQLANTNILSQASEVQQSADDFLVRARRNRLRHPQHHPPLSQGINSRILFQCQQDMPCHAEVAAILAAQDVDLAAAQIWPLSSLMSIDRLEVNGMEAPPVMLLAKLIGEHPSIAFAECDAARRPGDRQAAAVTPKTARLTAAEIRQSKTGNILQSLLSEAKGAASNQLATGQSPQQPNLGDSTAAQSAHLPGGSNYFTPPESAAAADVFSSASDVAAHAAASASADTPADTAAAGLAVNDPIWLAEWDRRVIGLTSRNASEDAGSLAGAWETQTDASAVIVCITDSGIDYTHPDLAANMWTNPGEVPGNGLDDDGNGIIDDVHGYNAVDNNGDIMDTDSHGTHTAGIVGAVANNGIGISGIAQKVQLMGCKAITGLDGHVVTSAAVKCIEYALQMGAHITSNSWGGMGANPDDSALKVAVKFAQAAGQLFVTAAGNDGLDDDTGEDVPSDFGYDIILPVAASTTDDEIAIFSNFGRHSVLLAAPGTSIVSTVPNARYFVYAGTSMACPQVSGAAALILGHLASLGANITGRGLEVKAVLAAGVEPLPAFEANLQTGGRLNVGQAMRLLPSPANLSALFSHDPSAPFPDPYAQPAPSIPEFDYNKQLFLESQSLHPGREIADHAEVILDGPLRANGTWFQTSGVLADGQAVYDCTCSSCLGPERIFALRPSSQPTADHLHRQWYSLRVEAQPSTSVMVTLFQEDPDAAGLMSPLRSTQVNAQQGRLSNVMSGGDSDYLLPGKCGGILDAVVDLPIQQETQYYAIVDGIGGYDGPFNVSFTSRPIATTISWADIASQDGFSVSGNLTKQGLPLFRCVDDCPEISCEDEPDVVWSFVAGSDAKLAIKSGPYNEDVDEGVLPGTGSICLVEGVGFVIGPCAAFDEPDDEMCAILANDVPRYAGDSNNTISQLVVHAGKTYYVSLNGANYDGAFELSVQIVPDIAHNLHIQEVAWDELLDNKHGAAGFHYDGLLINGTQDYDCPCQPGQCYGPEQLFAFTAQEDGFIAIQAQPFQEAEDLGLAAESACQQGGCYVGVLPYVYEERTPSVGLKEVMCEDPKVVQSERHKHLENTFEIRAGARYYMILDTQEGPDLNFFGSFPVRSAMLSMKFSPTHVSMPEA
ncbi:hypothetical protein WJX74_008256 [Apatococcus lobatus]|uniref:Peptidase S8/S53 domain-containing protein n=1 Tax=Apatococcus lobatus TaxID=904363 RepID=A0AAW1SH98_9CHLO